MKAKAIDVIHYNSKKEPIDIRSKESRSKIRQAVFAVVHKKIQK